MLSSKIKINVQSLKSDENIFIFITFLREIAFGDKIPNYQKFSDELSPKEYLHGENRVKFVFSNYPKALPNEQSKYLQRSTSIKNQPYL